MKLKNKRTVVIILIIAISLLLGIILNSLWNLIDNNAYYHKIISKYSQKYDVPEHLIYAIIKTESDFRPRVISQAGAIGLMQMLPSTFEWLTGDEHLGEHLDVASLTDPDVSIRYGTYYLKYLMQKFPVMNTAIAAYNAGEGRVARWLDTSEYSDGNGALTYIPIEETRLYVEKVNSSMDHYKNLYYTTKEN